MDLEKTLVNLRNGLFSIGGFGEKDLADARARLAGALEASGIDESTFAIGLLAVAAALFVGLVFMIVNRSSQEAVVHPGHSDLEDRIIAVEQMMNDMKNQMALVKGQVKADFGYLRQEVGELRETIAVGSTARDYSHMEDRGMAINGR